jgi:hypothetical protein
VKPYIRRCQPALTGCHGKHGGPWMLFTDREDAFTACATWDEALVALARWYERKAAGR